MLLKNKLYMILLLSALMVWSVFYLPVYASTGYSLILYEYSENNTSMIVSTSWLDEDLLRIDVLDTETEEISSLAIRLSDFVSDATNSPYIMVQAVDLDGNLSGVVQISNPFYDPSQAYAEPAEEVPGIDYANGYYDDIPQAGLTPDGTGTVMDNVITQNDIEFFTVFTEDGHEFFLVVDRQRNVDNVYLLNTVTLDDLVSLADPGSNAGGSLVSAIPTPAPAEPQPEEQPPIPQPDPMPEEQPAQNSGNNSSIIVIIVAAALFGGGAYYFKIVKGKNNYSDTDEEDEESEDDDFPFIEEANESEDTEERGEDV